MLKTRNKSAFFPFYFYFYFSSFFLPHPQYCLVAVVVVCGSYYRFIISGLFWEKILLG